MKVLHLGKYYPPYPGGIETYSQVVCEHLAEKGMLIDILVSNNINKFEHNIINKVNIYRLPRKFVLSTIPICPTMPVMVRYLVKHNQYDLIHLHFPNPMAEISILGVSRIKRLIITYHTNPGFTYKIKKIYIPIIRLILKRADKIIVTSEPFLKSSPLLESYRNKCVVIPICVDDYYLDNSTDLPYDDISNKYGNFILYVGNLSSYKGVQYLIEAIKNLDINLVIIGEGPYETDLKQLSQSLGILNRVFFLGKISNKSILKAYYKTCRLFCLPSLMETFGIVLVEAMACGKPVVSTELGTGTSYINHNNVTGLVVQPRSSEALSGAFNKLLNNDTLRIQMGNNARNRVNAEFATIKIINSLVALYKN